MEIYLKKDFMQYTGKMISILKWIDYFRDIYPDDVHQYQWKGYYIQVASKNVEHDLRLWCYQKSNRRKE